VCVCVLIEQRVHCGCIVSIHKYQLRDAGGVDCAKCARSTRAAMVCREFFSIVREFTITGDDGMGVLSACNMSHLYPWLLAGY
jgi:hypothetical protein